MGFGFVVARFGLLLRAMGMRAPTASAKGLVRNSTAPAFRVPRPLKRDGRRLGWIPEPTNGAESEMVG